MNQVVCLSTSNWHPFPTRKQQVMGRLKRTRVLYFDPPVSRAAPLKDPSAAARLRAWRHEGEHISDRITVYAMPPVLPMYYKFPFLNRMNQRKIGRYVRDVLQIHGFEKPVLWCYSPTSVDLLDHVPHSALIYDCVDRHSAYGGLMTPHVVDALEEKLARRANVVFATAQGLYDRLETFNDNTFLIPNGANFELFNKAATDSLPFPDELFNIQAPIIGFLGTLQPCIDLELLTFLADQRPQWSFVCIGPVQAGVDVTALKARKNIHILGLKPHKELPRYMARFDVCLNLFRPNSLSKDVSPLKFYEYLATGKPIVSTEQPDQVKQYADVITVATSPREFLAGVDAALKETNNWVVGKRIAYARAASWDNRVEEMTRILKDKGIFETTGASAETNG